MYLPDQMNSGHRGTVSLSPVKAQCVPVCVLSPQFSMFTSRKAYNLETVAQLCGQRTVLWVKMRILFVDQKLKHGKKYEH